MAAPWTRHYDPGVPPSLAPYPAKTLVDYVRERRATHGPMRRRSSSRARTHLECGSRSAERSLRRVAGRARASARRSRRAAAAKLPSVPDRRDRRVESGGHRAAAQSAVHGRRAAPAARDRGRRARRHAHAVLHAGEGNSARHAGEADHRHEHQGISAAAASRAVHAVQGEERRPPDRARAGRSVVSGLPRQSATSRRTRCRARRRAGRPGDHADERRDDRYAEGRRRPASLSRRSRRAACDVAAAAEERAGPDIALVPLPLFHVYACVGVQSHSIVSRTPMALVPNPRDIADLLKTIKTVRPTLFSAVPALFIALLNHPKVKSKVGRLQLDSRVFLRRGAADGGNEDAVRRADRRPNRRRLLADRSDDGVHRESAERPQQGRIGRRSAAGRRSGDRRRRIRRDVSAAAARRAKSFCVRRS